MRDPGPPRRNPFFEHGSDGAPDDPGMGWRDPADEPRAESFGGGADADPDPGAADVPGGFAALFALVEALGDAQPEAAEHLVAAAHEVVLAVKVMVDATEAVLAEQRAAMARSRTEADARGRGDGGDVTDLATVRRAEAP